MSNSNYYVLDGRYFNYSLFQKVMDDEFTIPPNSMLYIVDSSKKRLKKIKKKTSKLSKLFTNFQYKLIQPDNKKGPNYPLNLSLFLSNLASEVSKKNIYFMGSYQKYKAVISTLNKYTDNNLLIMEERLEAFILGNQSIPILLNKKSLNRTISKKDIDKAYKIYSKHFKFLDSQKLHKKKREALDLEYFGFFIDFVDYYTKKQYSVGDAYNYALDFILHDLRVSNEKYYLGKNFYMTRARKTLLELCLHFSNEKDVDKILKSLKGKTRRSIFKKAKKELELQIGGDEYKKNYIS